MRRGRETLPTELKSKGGGELVDELVLGRGGHEYDVRHRGIVATALPRAIATDSLSRVSQDLAAAKDGISERFVPERDRGRLIEVEHVVRYRWAAQVAASRSVLDAGCGTGYGSAILAAAGASEVIGIDIAAEVVTRTADKDEAVSLRAGDVRALDFEDGRFDLVVCFEVIEHLDDPMAALDELARVLAPDGLLLLSSPNRGVYPPGNPHHRHEFTPAELEAAVRERLPNVRLVHQSDHLVSALFTDDAVDAGRIATLDGLAVSRLDGDDTATYTVAAASRARLPDFAKLAVLGGTLEMREWLSALDVQTRAIGDKDAYIAELEERIGERERLAGLLTDAEHRQAGVPELQARIEDLERELGAARDEAAIARREASDLDRALLYGRRLLRHVRPLIQLLRKVRRRLRQR